MRKEILSNGWSEDFSAECLESLSHGTRFPVDFLVHELLPELKAVALNPTGRHTAPAFDRLFSLCQPLSRRDRFIIGLPTPKALVFFGN
jgi:hypothetical protein